MVDERLTGLALMYIHPEIDINVETVIDRYAAVQPAKKSKKKKCEHSTNCSHCSNLKRRRLNL